MSKELQTRPLDDILGASAAAPEFKAAVRALADGGRDERIAFNRGAPRVKVLRLLMKLLEAHPEIPFDTIVVEGRSGCSDFVGSAVAQPDDVRFEFEWNCHWRAVELGWFDAFGDPDQIRAARTYDYQCFRKLVRL
jgi:hypothetical protein